MLFIRQSALEIFDKNTHVKKTKSIFPVILQSVLLLYIVFYYYKFQIKKKKC